MPDILATNELDDVRILYLTYSDNKDTKTKHERDQKQNDIQWLPYSDNRTKDERYQNELDTKEARHKYYKIF